MTVLYSYVIADKENEGSIHHKLLMQECIINLYLALTYKCEDNIVIAVEVDLFHAVVQYIKVFLSVRLLSNLFSLHAMFFLHAIEW